MTQRDQQLERLREAVDRKSEDAEAASRRPEQQAGDGDDVTLGPTGDRQPGKVQGPQDVSSIRDKNTGHLKKTADKWNQ